MVFGLCPFVRSTIQQLYFDVNAKSCWYVQVYFKSGTLEFYPFDSNGFLHRFQRAIESFARRTQMESPFVSFSLAPLIGLKDDIPL